MVKVILSYCYNCKTNTSWNKVPLFFTIYKCGKCKTEETKDILTAINPNRNPLQ